MYESEQSDYRDFDLLLQKVELKAGPHKKQEDEQSVRASVESVRS